MLGENLDYIRVSIISRKIDDLLDIIGISKSSYTRYKEVDCNLTISVLETIYFGLKKYFSENQIPWPSDYDYIDLTERSFREAYNKKKDKDFKLINYRNFSDLYCLAYASPQDVFVEKNPLSYGLIYLYDGFEKSSDVIGNKYIKYEFKVVSFFSIRKLDDIEPGMKFLSELIKKKSDVGIDELTDEISEYAHANRLVMYNGTASFFGENKFTIIIEAEHFRDFFHLYVKNYSLDELLNTKTNPFYTLADTMSIQNNGDPKYFKSFLSNNVDLILKDSDKILEKLR